MSLLVFEQEDDDTWVVEGYKLPSNKLPIRVSAYHESDEFGIDNIKTISREFEAIDKLVTEAAALILENYSRDYFAKLGIEDSLLPEESVESMVEHIKLIEAYFFDLDERGFNLSFEVTWDPHHSFDVEFEAGIAITCAVNG